MWGTESSLSPYFYNFRIWHICFEIGLKILEIVPCYTTFHRILVSFNSFQSAFKADKLTKITILNRNLRNCACRHIWSACRHMWRMTTRLDNAALNARCFIIEFQPTQENNNKQVNLLKKNYQLTKNRKSWIKNHLWKSVQN
jgi:hypothetical protein